MKSFIFLVIILFPSICSAIVPYTIVGNDQSPQVNADFVYIDQNKLDITSFQYYVLQSTSGYAAGLINGTYQYDGSNGITVNANTANSATTAVTATTAGSLSNMNISQFTNDVPYATQSALTIVQQSTVTAGVQVPSMSQFNTQNSNQSTINSNVTSEITSLAVAIGGNLPINTVNIIPNVNNYSFTGVNTDTTTYAPSVALTQISNTFTLAWGIFLNQVRPGQVGLQLINGGINITPNQYGLITEIDYELARTGSAGSIFMVIKTTNNVIVSTSTSISYSTLSTSSYQQTAFLFPNPLLYVGGTYNIYITTTDPTFGLIAPYAASYGGAETNPQYIATVMPYSGSYTVQLSTTQTGAYNSFQLNATDTGINGSSVTYSVQFASAPTDTSQAWNPAPNGTLLKATSNYINVQAYYTRWVSTATPITTNLNLTMNPIVFISTVTTWDVTSTLTANVANISSATISNLSVSTETFSDGSARTSAYWGSWQNQTTNYGVQRSTYDGMVTAYCTNNSASAAEVLGYTDSSNPPTTLRAINGMTPVVGGTVIVGITFPVRRNDYWYVLFQNATVNGVYFIPMNK